VEFDPTRAIQAEPVEVPAHLFESPYQGYESWRDSELITCAQACMDELQRRGKLGTTRLNLWQRLKVLFMGKV
jgi:hypothetical protein